MKEWLFKIKQIKDFILDLIFPRQCLSCDQEGEYLCKQCREKIDFNQKDYCVFCHQPSKLSKVCPACQNQGLNLQAVWVSANYNDQKIENLIAALKYKFVGEISQILAKIIFQYLQSKNIGPEFEIFSDNCLLVPVPLHRRRFLSRGYNQSQLLAESLSQLTAWPWANLLIRQKNTISQVHLNRQERQKNVFEAFSLNPAMAVDTRKKIILIDDVVTTGSTLKECAKVLHNQGYQNIYGLVVAQREN